MKKNSPLEEDSDAWFRSILLQEFITVAEYLLLMYYELYIFLSEQNLYYPFIWAFVFISITSEREMSLCRCKPMTNFVQNLIYSLVVAHV